MGKKPIVSVTYENENFYVHGVHKNPKNGHKSARGPHRRRDETHILSKVSCFSLKSFYFRTLQKR